MTRRALGALLLSLAATRCAPAHTPAATSGTLVVLVTPGDATDAAAAMRRRGLSVATIAPSGTADDVVRAVGELHRGAARIVLVGEGRGATLATLAALAKPELVAGVVAIRGTYDDARPRPDAPPFLFFSPADDDPEHAQRARSFARALRAAGARSAETWVVPHRDASTILRWTRADDDLAPIVASFATEGPKQRPIESPLGAQQVWGVAPPLEHDAFWARKDLVVRRPANGQLEVALVSLFDESPWELNPWPRKEYAAIPLRAWLDTLDPRVVGTGDHLVVTNVRGEQLYLRREDVGREEPVIVVGIDDETNLHRLFTTYQVKREYSWKPDAGPMPVMVRTVGAFLFFPHGAPERLRDATMAGFGLGPDSFRFVKEDPLAVVRGLSPDLRDALAGPAGCLKCHSLRGAGARAHHVRAIDGKPHGAFALALDAYPRDVLRRFLFDQDAVAESFGVTPLRLPEESAKALFEFAARK